MPLSPAKFRLADRDVRRIAQAVTDLKSAEPAGNSNGNGNGRGKDDGSGNGNGTDLRKLLSSVNSASQAARNAWLGYLAILAYLLVTLAGVSHKNLLLNSPTKLPFVDVGIPLTGFFRFAPTVLLFFLFGLLLQHHMLYEKLINLRHELPPEPEIDDTPDVRDEIHSYFFAQAVVGRRYGRKHVLIAYRWMLFTTFIAAPLVLLLYFQTSFLPYHSESMTWWHRFNLIGGVAVLWWVGRDLRLMDQDLRGVSDLGVWNSIDEKVGPTLSMVCSNIGRFSQRLIGPMREFLIGLFALPWWFAKGAWAIGLFVSSLLVLSLLATSVPDRTMDKVAATLFPKHLISIDDWIKLIGGNRNLIVADQDLVKDNDIVEGEFVHSLRRRDLRYADFSRSDLKRTDFENAQLHHASFVQSDLKHSKFRTANIQGTNLFAASLQGADLGEASLQGADLRRARFQGADLRRAKIWRILTGEEITKSSFDARTINIDWPDGEAQAKARGAVSGLTRLANAMQREKTPGFERVAAARDHVTQTLASLLKLPTRRELIGMKENMCTLHALRNRVPSIDKAATGPETRATILADIACEDTTDNANVARNIARRISYNRNMGPDIARTFLNALDNKLCHHIREKLRKPLLRQLQKRAAEKRSPREPEELPIRPKDAADYYCTTPSNPDQLPIPQGPPF